MLGVALYVLKGSGFGSYWTGWCRCGGGVVVAMTTSFLDPFAYWIAILFAVSVVVAAVS